MIFGQIAEITGSSNFEMNDIADTNQLIDELNSRYPRLVNSKYAIAVNRNVIQNNTRLSEDCEIAILPPFSGG